MRNEPMAVVRREGPGRARGPGGLDDAPAVSGKIVFGDNLAFIRTLPSESIDLIYIDPPFNTGRVQSRKRLKTVHDDSAPDRLGFNGRGYRTTVIGQKSFGDAFEDFNAFITPRLEEAYRVLKPDGSLFLHLDYREVHYCKLYLDEIFGRASFINEIVWVYDYGARSTKKWSPKHDNILWYAKNPKNYVFDFAAIDRIRYMAPELVGREKAARGKTLSDAWWHTIVSPTGREKTGYPTQKPLRIIERIVRMHSNPGDTVLDFFAGSGTVGEACGKLGRKFILVDNNAEAIEVMKQRLARFNPEITVVPSLTKESTSEGVSVAPPNVHVIVAAVWDYEDGAFKGLRGPQQDVELVRQLFSSESSLGLYPKEQIEVLKNPTVEGLKSTLVRYAMNRSAKGDTLIFYFSGHGAVLANNQFALCLKDTKVRPDGGGCVPLSALRFDDIMDSLATADVHPVFIIDACFSGKAGQFDQNRLVGSMENVLHRAAGSSYGLLCACYAEGVAEDTANGGAFTKALLEVASAGLADKAHRQQPALKLADLSGPIQAELTRSGLPLSKLYLGPDLPEFPLVRNVAYQPRSEEIMGYHLRTLELLWNDGEPRVVTLTEIREVCGVSAYGNHSKLSLPPWNLAEDAGSSKVRQLTERGRHFMEGSLRIPYRIENSTGVWGGAKGAEEVTYSGLLEMKSGRRNRKKGGARDS